MSLQGTIVPGRLRLELCPWGVNVDEVTNITEANLNSHETFFVIFLIAFGVTETHESNFGTSFIMIWR